MARILADDFALVEGDGKRSTKADLLGYAKSGKTRYEHQDDTEQTVRVWGDTGASLLRNYELRASRMARQLTTLCGLATPMCGLPAVGGTYLVRRRCHCQVVLGKRLTLLGATQVMMRLFARIASA